MATSTDFTAFKIMTENCEVFEADAFEVEDYTLADFESYAKDSVQPGMFAQWYVPRTDDLLAEYSIVGGLTVYPTADLFD